MTQEAFEFSNKEQLIVLRNLAQGIMERMGDFSADQQVEFLKILIEILRDIREINDDRS